MAIRIYADLRSFNIEFIALDGQYSEPIKKRKDDMESKKEIRKKI